MAKLIKKESPLRQEYSKLRLRRRRCGLFALIFVIISVASSFLMKADGGFTVGIALLFAAILGFILCICLTAMLQNQIAIKKQGLEGEEASARLLENALPESYTVFQNCIIDYEEKSSELDLIAVGKNGVFVIETKNRNGIIKGNYNSKNWTQHKIGQGGGAYKSDFYNPVKQVATHIYRLAGFLRANGIKAHINGAVYFSNPDAELSLTGEVDKIPVFSSTEDLILYIKTNNASLPLETKEKICALLK